LALPIPGANSANEELIAIICDGRAQAGLAGALAVVAPLSCFTRRIFEKFGKIIFCSETCTDRLTALYIS